MGPVWGGGRGQTQEATVLMRSSLEQVLPLRRALEWGRTHSHKVQEGSAGFVKGKSYMFKTVRNSRQTPE